MKAVTILWCGVVSALVLMSEANPKSSALLNEQSAADPENNPCLPVTLSNNQLNKISTEIKQTIPFVEFGIGSTLMVDEVRIPNPVFEVCAGEFKQNPSGDSLIVLIHIPKIMITTYWVTATVVPRFWIHSTTFQKSGGGRTYVYENVAIKLRVNWPAEDELQVVKSASILQMKHGKITRQIRYKKINPVDTYQPGKPDWKEIPETLTPKLGDDELAKVLATSVMM